MSSHRLGWLLLLLLLCGLVLGCGGEDTSKIPLGSVSGTVTYNKKKLTGGTVVFMTKTKQQGEIKSYGIISAEGTYKVNNCPLGLARIVVETGSLKPPPGVTQPSMRDGVVQRTYMFIPLKYARDNLSGLTLDVKSAGQVFDIELK